MESKDNVVLLPQANISVETSPKSPGSIHRSSGSLNSSSSSASLKYLSLFVLVFQNACQVLLIRYSKTRTDVKEQYLSTAAVFFTEIVKLLACLVVIGVKENSVTKCLAMVRDQIVQQPLDTMKVCVPALIYTVQNNLLYIAVSNLDAATFMVTYQLKILTTALFSVWMLRKSLSWSQWFSLVLLFAGVSLVQLQDQSVAKKDAKLFTPAQDHATPKPDDHSLTSTLVSSALKSRLSQMSNNQLLGLSAVVVACLLSGFAGVYFEKILKSSHVTVWMRNVQLAVLALPISYATVMISDRDTVMEHGMLYGFDKLVWLIVCVYALGGLTVAVVIKYADNILKGFATSAAIVVSCVASVFLFDFFPSNQFLLGTFLVMTAIYVYSKYPFQSTTK